MKFKLSAWKRILYTVEVEADSQREAAHKFFEMVPVGLDGETVVANDIDFIDEIEEPKPCQPPNR